MELLLRLLELRPRLSDVVVVVEVCLKGLGLGSGRLLRPHRLLPAWRLRLLLLHARLLRLTARLLLYARLLRLSARELLNPAVVAHDELVLRVHALKLRLFLLLDGAELDVAGKGGNLLSASLDRTNLRHSDVGPP